MAAYGPFFGRAASSVHVDGTVDWDAPNNVLADDGNFCNCLSMVSDISWSLRVKNPDFSTLPNTRLIGCEVTASIATTGTTIVDYVVRLVVGDVVVGSNMALGPVWPSSAGVRTWGGPTSLWGYSLSYALIDANFGVAIQCQGSNDAQIDWVKFTLYTGRRRMEGLSR